MGELQDKQGLYDFFVGGLHLVMKFSIPLLGERRELKNGYAVLIRELDEAESKKVMDLEVELFGLWSESLERLEDDSEFTTNSEEEK